MAKTATATNIKPLFNNVLVKPLDAEKTAELLLETLYAFSKCVSIQSAVPDPNAFRTVLKRQQEVMKLFYEGLKRESWLRQKTETTEKN